MLILFLRELRDRIVPLRRHVEIVPLHHQTALVPRLRMISHQFKPVIIGQIGRQTFHPIPAFGAIEHGIADPRMHDLMAERVGLHIMPLDDAAPQQGERGHAEPARKEILHHGELLERIGAQQRDIDVQVARGGIEIFIRQMRIIGKEIGREPNPLTGLGRPVAKRCDKCIRHERDGLARLRHGPFCHHHFIVATEPNGTGTRLTGPSLGHDGPPRWHSDQQRIGAERFRDIRIPVALAAHIDAFRPDMSGSLTGRHKSKMARIARRIVDGAMVVHIQRHRSGSHDLRGDEDLLRRLRRRTMLEFKRHIVNRDLLPGRFLHECNVVDLKRGGEGETDRRLCLRHLKGQPVLGDERMLLRDDLYK